MESEANREPADRPWHIVTRWQSFAGEARANLLRVIGVGVFYCIELVNYYGLRLGPLNFPPVEGTTAEFHKTVTALAVCWVLLAIAIRLALTRQFFPESLKYATTGCDIALLTAVLSVANGAISPLIVVYLLVIAVAALRFSVPLVWFATIGSTVGYIILLGEGLWWRTATMPPRDHQLVFVTALVLMGVIVGQLIRRVRRLAVEYATRLANDQGRTP